jgi:hypothetical protein
MRWHKIECGRVWVTLCECYEIDLQRAERDGPTGRLVRWWGVYCRDITGGWLRHELLDETPSLQWAFRVAERHSRENGHACRGSGGPFTVA